ncbi:origin recognition complex subunit 6 [Neofusicoccum parvum]|nr:origin recognition complex subunit 6 [Neofusicoccum parvum]
MSKPVEQALTGLVPSLNAPLPPELLNVAVSLLAQSRSKASSLKPDEEIARTYACAHLACERLKQRLNLPPIVARPPIPPRAYKKVYTYFDSALTTASSSSAPQTPSKRARAADPPPAAAKPTPSKAPPGPGARTPTSARRTAAGRKGEDDAPPWTMPLIRQLCRALGAPAAAPHAYAGVCSVLRAGGAASSPSPSATRSVRKRRVGAVEGEAAVPATVVVVLLYTMVRLAGTPTSGREHRERRARAVEVLAGCEACAGRGEDELAEEVEGLLAVGRERGWLEMEWFGNVVEGSGLGVEGAGDEDEDVEMEDARSAANTPVKRRRTGEGVQTAVSQGGLGTMMQDKVDYLSEPRRVGFLRWKEQIMKRVEEIERETNGQDMDVSG